jgi:photosystem II stability/assembly factor-like uncharacterized protein
MPAHNPPLRHSLLAAVILCAVCLSGVAQAEKKQSVPDLLYLPALESKRAQQSLQLAVARAGDRFVAVGERGIVQLSDDGGHTWRQAKNVPVSVALTDVDFVSARIGWAVGHSGVVLRSVDAGETWLLQLDGNKAAQVVLEDARQRLVAGQAGAEKALRTAEYLVQDGPDKPFLDVAFQSDNHGYVVGAYGLALETHDGGKTWQSLMGRIPNPRGKHLYQVRIKDQQLLICGEQGTLFRSTDGGGSFVEVRTPYSGTFFGALNLDAQGLLAYGLRGNAWRSLDGGTSWQKAEVGQPVTLSAGLRLRDGSVLLADESGRLLRSTDNALSFAPLPVQQGTGITGIVEAADGGLILSSARGMSRIELDAIDLGVKP